MYKIYKYEIVYKKTDEWYIEWQRVIMSDNEDSKWYNEWQRVVQQVTKSGTTSHSDEHFG